MLFTILPCNHRSMLKKCGSVVIVFVLVAAIFISWPRRKQAMYSNAFKSLNYRIAKMFLAPFCTSSAVKLKYRMVNSVHFYLIWIRCTFAKTFGTFCTQNTRNNFVLDYCLYCWYLFWHIYLVSVEYRYWSGHLITGRAAPPPIRQPARRSL